MDIVCAQWNHDGSVLAIGGVQFGQDQKEEINIIQFFNPWGLVTITTSETPDATADGTGVQVDVFARN